MPSIDQKAIADSMIKGRLLWVRVLETKSGSVFPVKTVLPGLTVRMLSSSAHNVGECLWVIVTSNINGDIMTAPYSFKAPHAANKIGIVYCARVDSVQDSSMTALISPFVSISITNYKEAYPNTAPASGDLCAVEVDYITAFSGTGRVVFTESSSAKASKPSERKQSFDLDSIPIDLSPDHLILPASTVRSPAFSRSFIVSAESKEQNIKTLVAESYSKAKNMNCVFPGGAASLWFPSSRPNGNAPEFFSIQRYRQFQNQWYIIDFGVPTSIMRQFFAMHAHLRDENAAYTQLAKIAANEEWRFSRSNDEYEILQNYINYTYFYAWFNHSFAEDTDYISGKKYRIFNTGLFDYRCSDIYCLLSSTPTKSSAFHQAWEYVSFFTKDTPPSFVQSVLNSHFSAISFPDKINFIEDVSDLFLDHTWRIQINYTHILCDNAERLPLDFYLDAMPAQKNARLSAIVNDLQSENAYTRSAAYKSLKQFILSDETYQKRLIQAFNDAVDLSRALSERNYKMVTPSFYPVFHQLSLLLPLYLRSFRSPEIDYNRPDCVLVISKSNDRYLGSTVFTLQMAYQHARLISKPYGDWLTPQLL